MNFWQNFEQASCWPDGCNCELVQDALIRQPSAFWSSFAYLFLAVRLHKQVASKSHDLWPWTTVCIILGLSSLFGHGSFIRLALAVDFASIVMVIGLFAFLRTLRQLDLSKTKIHFSLILFYGLTVWAMYVLDKWTKVMMCVVLFVFSLWELRRTAGANFLGDRNLRLSISVLLISFVFFLLDEFKVACVPQGLFQLHSIWHLGTAVAIYYYGKWRFADQAA